MKPSFRKLCAAVTAMTVLTAALPITPVFALEDIPAETVPAAAVPDETTAASDPEPLQEEASAAPETQEETADITETTAPETEPVQPDVHFDAPVTVTMQDDEAEEPALTGIITGTWGENITWELDADTGTLTVSGEGGMVRSSSYYSDMPFYAYRSAIKTAVFGEGITSVCNYALLECENLTSVTLPSTLTAIGEAAFEKCKALTNITIPETVTTIEQYAFQDCEALTTVWLPSGVTTIPKYTFEGCTALESVTIPDTVTAIESSAFENCTALTAVKLDSVTIIGASAFEDCSALASCTLSKKLTTIGNRAFSGTALTKVTLPNTVELLDAFAFYRCQSLAEVTLPNKLTELSNGVFENCEALTSLTIPASVTEIGKSAFEGSGLTEITVPGTVTTIGETAFANCKSLETATLEEGVQTLSTKAFAGCETLKTISLPKSLSTLGADVFADTLYGKDLAAQGAETGFTLLDNGTLYSYTGIEENVIVPDGVTSIAAGVFTGAAVKSVVVPEGVTDITGAFKNATTLESVTLPDSLTTIGAETFSGCTALTSVTFGKKLTEIGRAAFKGDTALTALSLPDTLTTIDYEVFSGCTALADMTIPASVNYVGGDAFKNTPFLYAYPEDMVIFGSTLYYYKGKDTSVTVPEGITMISQEAFAFCMDLEQVELPSTLTRIGQWAFLGCHSLTSLIIPESVTQISERAIGYYCQNGTSGQFDKLSAMTLYGTAGSEAQTYAEKNELNFVALEGVDHTCGENLTWALDPATGVLTISGTGAMPDYASPEYRSSDETRPQSPFYDYRGLIRSVVIKKGVTNVGTYAFYGCKSITSVTIPSTVTAIGASAFYQCSSLPAVKFPDAVTSIGRYAFAYTGLQSVKLPAGLTEMPEYAFYKCESLTDVTLSAGITSFETSMMDSCPNLRSINIPEENVKFTSVNGVVYDAARTSLVYFPPANPTTTITLPSGSTTLGTSLQGARNLRTVIVPRTVNEAYSNAFKNCTSLERVIFLGAAPEATYKSEDANYPHFAFSQPVTLSCSFTADGWAAMQTECENDETTRNILWDDLDAVAAVNSLKLTSDTTELTVGSTLRITPKINPMLAVDFVWEVKNPAVASISPAGVVTGLQTGKTVVTCTSADGKYTASLTITVNAQTESSQPGTAITDHEAVELDAELVGKPFLSMQFPCEARGGVYFLNNTKLHFYSLAEQTASLVFDFDGSTAAYAQGDLLYVLSKTAVQVYDMAGQKLQATYAVPAGFTGTAVGADTKGRIYIAACNSANDVNNRIFLLSPEGELLSQTSYPTRVYTFDGFEETTGRFFVESFYNYYSWGYDHPGRGLTMGMVDDEGNILSLDSASSFLESGIITRSFDCILYLCQNVYFHHQNGADVLGGKYLTAASVLTSRVNIMDASAIHLDTLQSVTRTPSEDESAESYTDYESVGVRGVYNAAHDSIILYENGCILNEYDPNTGTVLSTAQTSYPVYNLLKLGDHVVSIEKADGQYYLETLDWSDPEKISITADHTKMTVGETLPLQLQNGTGRTTIYQWTSSDPMGVSVTAEGRVTAWKAGEYQITCQSGALKATITLTVTEPETEKVKNNILAEGVVTNNVSDNDYTIWSSPMHSFLFENADGTLTRVEYLSEEEGVLVETYDKTYALLSSQKIDAELPIFGGFYSAADANYMVFGQSNENEDDSVEIMRVVKFDKKWKRVSACSVKGANTYIPFDAGSLRMEENGGSLYIHTCHEMYDDGDGLHHQANMTYVLNESSMKMEQSYYDVMNVVQTGYVSHSFGQFLATDETYLFRADHGDSGPRSLALTRCNLDGKITDVTYVDAYKIGGYSGDNATGVSLGGMALSDANCLLAFNSVDMNADSYRAGGQRNIYLTVVDKKMTTRTLRQITHYTDEDNITPHTPQLVKLSNDAFLLMWEEVDGKAKRTTVKMQTFNGDGTETSPIVTMSLTLSDCQPIQTADGMVRWYSTDGSKMHFYTINPYTLGQGGEISYEFDEETATLTLIGSGDMADYDNPLDTPWASLRDQITHIVVEKGVTGIGRNAFAGCTSLTDVQFPDTLTLVDESAFIDCLRLTEVTVPSSVTEIGENAFGYVSMGPTALSDFSIHGSVESAAQTYAAENGLQFLVDNVVYGDANGDGTVELVDILTINRYLCGADSELSPYATYAADCWRDGKINGKDSITILRFLLGLADSLPEDHT